MRYHVFPDKLRKQAEFLLKIRYYLLALLFLGIAMFITGETIGNETIMVAGVFVAVVGVMFFLTFRANDALIGVEIRDDGIHVVDRRGASFRHAEYRYVRGMEVRTLQLTKIPYEGNKHHACERQSGIETKLIIVYIDSASCFEDLGIDDVSRDGSGVYWCDKLLYHNSCIAFEYSENALGMLKTKLGQIGPT